MARSNMAASSWRIHEFIISAREDQLEIHDTATATM
jgi:hypothetical protein